MAAHGLGPGDLDALAAAYRDFLLRGQTVNAASRKPYIFYNTWNFQERNKWWNGRAYLDSMTQERMLAEIEVAHQMGIEVFVLDTGWYEKTGDWRVNLSRFPDGLKAVREKLERLRHEGGLWFNPTVAAISSKMRRDHEDCVMSWHGRPHDPQEIWETEASQGLCLVSRYADAFADELIRLSREVGVTYFKWDGIGQYGWTTRTTTTAGRRTAMRSGPTATPSARSGRWRAWWTSSARPAPRPSWTSTSPRAAARSGWPFCPPANIF